MPFRVYRDVRCDILSGYIVTNQPVKVAGAVVYRDT